ncbi:AAA family ATPase [Patescibacteria group bacterium]
MEDKNNESNPNPDPNPEQESEEIEDMERSLTADTPFDKSLVSSLLHDLKPATIEDDSNLTKMQINKMVYEFRAAIARLRVLPEIEESDLDSEAQMSSELSEFLDSDLLFSAQSEVDPNFEKVQERLETEKQLKNLMQYPSVLEAYREIYNRIYSEIQKVKKLSDIFLHNEKLRPFEKKVIVRQLSRMLHNLINWVEDEIQNTHNQVSRDRRGYAESDRKILEKMRNYEADCQAYLDKFLEMSPEAKIQFRLDEIMLNKQTLNRTIPEDVEERRKGLTRNGFIMTDSRKEFIVGNRETLEKSMLSALRHRQNIELFGPTGTGKTSTAEYAAKLFSGKPAVVVPGDPTASKADFLGRLIGLDKRQEGNLITALKENRVLIIDEDNVINPKALIVLKSILGKKVGDIWRHPDTGEEFVIPPEFGIMVTRNEKGKHHRDRHDLPPEYRREFSIASFEVDYMTPDEMYDEFLVPLLCDKHGGMDLSEGEVGGKENDPGSRSPLLALVLVAKDIQDLYKSQKIKDGVVDTGYLLSLFADFYERKEETGCSILEFLDARLMAFVKRPIGVPARKKIIEVLINHGFFQGKRVEDFATKEEAPAITQDNLTAWRTGAGALFKDIKKGEKLTSKEVAELDPFEKRQEDPYEERREAIMNFRNEYMTACEEFEIDTEIIDIQNFASKREAITTGFTEYCEGIFEFDPTRIDLAKRLQSLEQKNDIEFIDEFHKIIQLLEIRRDKIEESFKSEYNGQCKRLEIDPIPISARNFNQVATEINRSINNYLSNLGPGAQNEYSSMKADLIENIGTESAFINGVRTFLEGLIIRKNVIQEFKGYYEKACKNLSLSPVEFDELTFDSKRTEIVDGIRGYVGQFQGEDIAIKYNNELDSTSSSADNDEYMEKVLNLLKKLSKLDKAIKKFNNTYSRSCEALDMQKTEITPQNFIQSKAIIIQNIEEYIEQADIKPNAEWLNRQMTELKTAENHRFIKLTQIILQRTIQAKMDWFKTQQNIPLPISPGAQDKKNKPKEIISDSERKLSHQEQIDEIPKIIPTPEMWDDYRRLCLRTGLFYNRRMMSDDVKIHDRAEHALQNIRENAEHALQNIRENIDDLLSGQSTDIKDGINKYLEYIQTKNFKKFRRKFSQLLRRLIILNDIPTTQELTSPRHQRVKFIPPNPPPNTYTISSYKKIPDKFDELIDYYNEFCKEVGIPETIDNTSPSSPKTKQLISLDIAKNLDNFIPENNNIRAWVEARLRSLPTESESVYSAGLVELLEILKAWKGVGEAEKMGSNSNFKIMEFQDICNKFKEFAAKRGMVDILDSDSIESVSHLGYDQASQKIKAMKLLMVRVFSNYLYRQ